MRKRYFKIPSLMQCDLCDLCDKWRSSAAQAVDIGLEFRENWCCEDRLGSK